MSQLYDNVFSRFENILIHKKRIGSSKYYSVIRIWGFSIFYIESVGTNIILEEQCKFQQVYRQHSLLYWATIRLQVHNFYEVY